MAATAWKLPTSASVIAAYSSPPRRWVRVRRSCCSMAGVDPRRTWHQRRRRSRPPDTARWAPGPAYYVDRFARTVGLPRERTDGMMRLVVERVGRSVESLDALVAARSARISALIFHDPADREVPFTFAEQMAATWGGSRLVARPM